MAGARLLLAVIALALWSGAVQAQSALPGTQSGPTVLPPPPPPSPPTLQDVATDEAFGILGKQVRGAAGENMGVVVDILVGGDGEPRAAVIDFGGFLGVGNRKVAIDWRLLQFQPGDRQAPILLNLIRAQVQAAPEYKSGADKAKIIETPPGPETPVPPAAPSEASPPPLPAAPAAATPTGPEPLPDPKK